MNNKKKNTMFSVENLDDGSGISVKTQGHPAAIGFMIAIGLAKYFCKGNAAISMEDFIPVLENAYEDSDFLKLMVQAASLYAKDEKNGLKAFAMLMAAAGVKSTSEGKMN